MTPRLFILYRGQSHMLKQGGVLLLTLMLLVLGSCRDEDVIFVPEEVNVAAPVYDSISGFYVLNEGNMGTNKATLDWYSATQGKYYRNIFAHANPTEPMEMGDVGNDIGIYGSKLYAVINCSNKIDVMDKHSVKKIGQINIPNCRYIKFYKGYAYITSYAGPVKLDPEYKQRGYVAKVDTATLQVVDTCLVGFQPDQLEILNGKIYVANSGGYMVPNYENTLSVIDIESFSEVERVPIAINLLGVKSDKRGLLWVISRGDYFGVRSNIYVYNTRTRHIEKAMDVPASNYWLDGDSLYVISTQWSYITKKNEISYAIINTASMKTVTRNFITDGTDKEIRIPYGIAVNPISKDIYVTDAKDYVSPGRLYCFGQDGKQKWNVRTGDIPAHFVFLGNNTNKQ